MNAYICDVCKKEVENPINGINYFHIREKDLCESCHNDLELAMKQTMRSKIPFDFSWYEIYEMQLINKAVKSGGF